MSATFLERIVAKTRSEVAAKCRGANIAALRKQACHVRQTAAVGRFRNALEPKGRPNIIAEIKRSSPSKGVINDQIDVAEVARCYAAGGAAAISVLTEKDFFKGSLHDLLVVRATVDLPVLRKDFTIDEYQIYEAAEAGADAILLIVAALTESELTQFRTIAEDELQMDAIVEVHCADELEIARRIGAKIIGVNNRNLKTFDVSLDVSRRLISHRPLDTLMIAESGLSTRQEIDELHRLGFDAFLIGETLMREPHMLSTLAGGAA